MARAPRPTRVIIGDAELLSPAFSNQWQLVQDDREIAQMTRFPKRHVSQVRLEDGTTWWLEPHGWGTVEAMQGDEAVGRIRRRSWWGRRWEITSLGFAYDLISDPLPRAWSLTLGNEAVCSLRGTVLSYNRLRMHSDIAVPVLTIVLAWQVIARPWEAAAHPGGLVPVRRIFDPGNRQGATA